MARPTTSDDYIEKFIDLTDRIAAHLTRGEQTVLYQIFSRSIGSENNTCALSYYDLSELTGASLPTVRKSIIGLFKRGIIVSHEKAGPWTPTTYRIQYPISEAYEPSKARLRRPLPAPCAEPNILDTLTEEGLDLIDRTYRGLEKTELAKYRELAERTLRHGCSLDIRIRELIAEKEFSPEKLRSLKKDGTGNRD